MKDCNLWHHANQYSGVLRHAAIMRGKEPPIHDDPHYWMVDREMSFSISKSQWEFSQCVCVCVCVYVCVHAYMFVIFQILMWRRQKILAPCFPHLSFVMRRYSKDWNFCRVVIRRQTFSYSFSVVDWMEDCLRARQTEILFICVWMNLKAYRHQTNFLKL